MAMASIYKLRKKREKEALDSEVEKLKAQIQIAMDFLKKLSNETRPGGQDEAAIVITKIRSLE